MGSEPSVVSVMTIRQRELLIDSPNKRKQLLKKS
jgi:hypothetical protein